MPDRTASQEYFATKAGDWDRLRAGFFSEAVREAALKAALKAAGVKSGQIIGQVAADLGAGTGFVTEALLKAGLGVFAVDQSPDMLARLSAKFPKVTALRGEAENLPLPDASVDFVFANMFLHHVDDPAKAIAEMARIVRPGGRVVLTDLDSHSHRFLLVEHHDRWPGFARADVSGWLAAAGLEGARVDCCGENCCATAQDGGDSARVSIFVASGKRPVCPVRAADLSDAERLAAGLRARGRMDAVAPLLCAESVLLAVSEALGAASPLIPRVATGFCSGLSRSCGACGAFSAGVMALGLALGRDTGQDDLDDTYGPVQEFREFFLARFGALDCRELTGHDLGAPEGLLAYRAEGKKQSVCFPILEAATAEVLRILAER